MSDQSDHTQDDFGGDDILAAELSLGLLSGDTLTQTQRRARIDMEFAALVESWDARFAQLSEEIAPVTPPKGLFRKIEQSAYPESRKRIWQSLGILPAFLGAGAAALVLIAALGFGSYIQPGTPLPTHEAQMTGEGSAFVLSAAYTHDTGRLIVARQAGERPTGRDLELWVIIGDGAPVSLGVLSATETIDRISIPVALRDDLPGATLAVTDEPVGGSPSGDPTGAIHAAGEVTSI